MGLRLALVLALFTTVLLLLLGPFPSKSVRVLIAADVRQPEGFVSDFLPLATRAFADAGMDLVFKPGAPGFGRVGPSIAVVHFRTMEKAVAFLSSPAFRHAEGVGGKYALIRVYLIDPSAPLVDE